MWIRAEGGGVEGASKGEAAGATRVGWGTGRRWVVTLGEVAEICLE